MIIPKETMLATIPRVPVFMQAPICYLMERVITDDISGLNYDTNSDLIIYHRVIDDKDRESFPLAFGEVLEMWILQSAGTPV